MRLSVGHRQSVGSVCNVYTTAIISFLLYNWSKIMSTIFNKGNYVKNNLTPYEKKNDILHQMILSLSL